MQSNSFSVRSCTLFTTYSYIKANEILMNQKKGYIKMHIIMFLCKVYIKKCIEIKN